MKINPIRPLTKVFPDDHVRRWGYVLASICLFAGWLVCGYDEKLWMSFC